MYEEFLQAVLTYVQALNKATASIEEKPDLTPYVQFVPVLLSDELCGFLVDEADGSYSYRRALASDLEWWENRPWKCVR